MPISPAHGSTVKIDLPLLASDQPWKPQSDLSATILKRVAMEDVVKSNVLHLSKTWVSGCRVKRDTTIGVQVMVDGNENSRASEVVVSCRDINRLSELPEASKDISKSNDQGPMCALRHSQTSTFYRNPDFQRRTNLVSSKCGPNACFNSQYRFHIAGVDAVTIRSASSPTAATEHGFATTHRLEMRKSSGYWCLRGDETGGGRNLPRLQESRELMVNGWQ